jgi:hypothetical protein
MGPLLDAEGGTPSAAEIADVLASHGECAIRVGPLPTQHLVDLHWTAHRAGQLLGIRVRVFVESPATTIDPTVTVRISPRRHDSWRYAAN